MASGKVEIEWLEPAKWVGRCQKYPVRQIYGKIEDGAEVMVSYGKRKWKARIISSGRMRGRAPQLPREDSSSSECSSDGGNTLAQQIQRDRKKIDEFEKRQEELNRSYVMGHQRTKRASKVNYRCVNQKRIRRRTRSR